MKLPNLSSPLKLFSPAPAQPAFGVAGLGGSMMFASSGGGGGFDPDDEYEYDDYSSEDEPAAQDASASAERRPRATRSSRGGDATGGRPRTSQFQPEERYWTDYLRIALPVIGLLLMIGLLWFWADRLINDDPDTTEPTATEDIGLVTTASPTPPAQIQSTPPPPTTGGSTDTTAPTPADTTGDGTTAGTTDATTEQETTTETAPPADDAGGSAFSDGQQVTAVEDLNLRPNPTTEGDVLMVVSAGDALTINGGPEEGESYVWWEVVTADGTIGWVVEDFIEPAE